MLRKVSRKLNNLYVLDFVLLEKKVGPANIETKSSMPRRQKGQQNVDKNSRTHEKFTKKISAGKR